MPVNDLEKCAGLPHPGVGRPVTTEWETHLSVHSSAMKIPKGYVCPANRYHDLHRSERLVLGPRSRLPKPRVAGTVIEFSLPS